MSSVRVNKNSIMTQIQIDTQDLTSFKDIITDEVNYKTDMLIECGEYSVQKNKLEKPIIKK